MTNNDRASYIVPARELAYFRLGSERVDVRRWPVFSADGRLVGAVDKLMIEASSRKVRYLSVSLIENAVHDYRSTAIGSVLVPIGEVQRLDDRQAIKLNQINARSLGGAPRLPARAIHRGDEDTTLACYGMSTSCELPAADFYKRPEFDEGTIGSRPLDERRWSRV